MSSNLPDHDDDVDVDYVADYLASSGDNNDDCFTIFIFWLDKSMTNHPTQTQLITLY